MLLTLVATPHNGSGVANSARIIANIIDACSPYRPARGLLGTLRKDSRVLFEITEDFVEKIPKLQIVSVYEMQMTTFGPFKRLVCTFIPGYPDSVKYIYRLWNKIPLFLMCPTKLRSVNTLTIEILHDLSPSATITIDQLLRAF